MELNRKEFGKKFEKEFKVNFQKKEEKDSK